MMPLAALAMPASFAAATERALPEAPPLFLPIASLFSTDDGHNQLYIPGPSPPEDRIICLRYPFSTSLGSDKQPVARFASSLPFISILQ